jgi:hypothetical protein
VALIRGTLGRFIPSGRRFSRTGSTKEDTKNTIYFQIFEASTHLPNSAPRISALRILTGLALRAALEGLQNPNGVLVYLSACSTAESPEYIGLLNDAFFMTRAFQLIPPQSRSPRNSIIAILECPDGIHGRGNVPQALHQAIDSFRMQTRYANESVLA